MNLSHAYGPLAPHEQGVRLLRQALDLGCTLFDTASLPRSIHRHDQFQPGDLRLAIPRFQAGTLEQNLKLLAPLREIAQRIGCTTGQLALGWLLTHDGLIPIPGATRLDRLEENLAGAEIRLDAETVAELDSLFHPHDAAGTPHNAATQHDVDTEEIPAWA